MEVIYRNDTSICARYEFNGEPHYYLIDLSKNTLSIYSSSNSIKIFKDSSIQFSEGYGVILNEQSSFYLYFFKLPSFYTLILLISLVPFHFLVSKVGFMVFIEKL